MSYSHNTRSHPEVPANMKWTWGTMHKWQKKQVHKGIRRFYKNDKWLAAATVDGGVLNTSN